MVPLLALYLLVFVVVAATCGLALLADGGLDTLVEDDKRFLSRVVLLSPVWPLALIGLIIWSIKPLWKMSGWSK